MSDFDGRDTFETLLNRVVMSHFNRIRAELTARLEAMDNIEVLSALIRPSEWDVLTAPLRTEIEPALVQTYMVAAGELSDELSQVVGVDDAAAGWAEAQAFDLVNGMNRTSQRRLQGVLDKWRGEPTTNQELIENLSILFGRSRAEAVAVTEVTRAASAGQEKVAEELRGQGFDITSIWQTMMDERVCPVCGPRHNQPRGSNWTMLPPAHVFCRCFVSHEVAA